MLVHGLNGDGAATWTAPDGTYWPALMRSDSQHFDDFRIYVYQYETRMFGSCLAVTDLANEMVDRLKYDKVLGHQKIVFVAHSMGGILVRQMLLRNPDVAQTVPAVIFFATPTGGATAAGIVSVLPTCVQVDDLRPLEVNSYLKSLQDNWLNSPLQTQVTSHCGFETRSVLVDRPSASLLCTRPPAALPTDHTGTVKPSTIRDRAHIMVANTLQDVVTTSTQAERKAEVIQSLTRYLAEANALYNRCLGMQHSVANMWARSVEEFLRRMLGESYVVRFRDSSGVPTDLPTSPSGSIDERDIPACAFLNVRRVRLRQFIERLS